MTDLQGLHKLTHPSLSYLNEKKYITEFYLLSVPDVQNGCLRPFLPAAPVFKISLMYSLGCFKADERLLVYHVVEADYRLFKLPTAHKTEMLNEILMSGGGTLRHFFSKGEPLDVTQPIMFFKAGQFVV